MSPSEPSAETPAFAIVRIDDFQPAESDPRVRITVKEIVFSQVIADAEVARLSRLNGDKCCTYFVSPTRVRTP
jgi:hypothetical protein